MECIKELFTTAVAISGTNLVLTIPPTAFNNCQRFRLIICQPLPSGITNALTVVIADGTTNYPLLQPLGNNVMADMIRSRRAYEIVVGTSPAHFTCVSCDKLCKTTFPYPQLVPTTA